jgi:hypothetical protein
MFNRVMLITATALYAIVIALVVWPGAIVAPVQADDTPLSDSPDVLKQLPFCGVSMQLQDIDNLAGYERCCDEIAAQGADTVLFVPSASMENGKSTLIYLDMRHTFTKPQLEELIHHAKADHLRVILMPIVLLDAPINDEWRGTISPDDWDAWFASYQDMILFYGRVAQESGVDMLVIGSELVSAEPYVDDWDNTIRKVRSVYTGLLTYSSNWDHYSMVQFWDKLDVIGMNSYWALGDTDSSVKDINSRWADIQKDVFHWDATSANKPIILLEAGWCSLSNSAKDSWDYTQTQLPVDLDLQKRLYEAFFESWWGQPKSAGFIMWEWPPDEAGGPTDKGYTPRGKPAADVMKQWFAKPRWQVQ